MTQHPGSARQTFDAPASRAEQLYLRLRAAGRRDASTAMAGEALPAYWRFVGGSTIEERADLVRRLRADIAAGRTGPRACLAVALGEPRLELAREATRAYLGEGPTSAERRERAVDDVLDWIRRALALNRAALCCALLDTANGPSLERLARLRSRFAPAEVEDVFDAVGRAPAADVATFLDEWRALCA